MSSYSTRLSKFWALGYTARLFMRRVGLRVQSFPEAEDPGPPPPEPGAPIVGFTGALNITATSVDLQTTVNPLGLATTIQWEYGQSTAYGSTFPAVPQSIGSGSLDVPVSSNVVALLPSTLYHFRMKAVSAAGTTFSVDRTFQTGGQAGAPGVIANAATSITGSSATLSGTVDANGLATSYQWEYGLTTAYGSTVPALLTAIGSSAIAVAVSNQLSGLIASRTYHFRLRADSSAGTSRTADRSFTTSSGGVVGTPSRISITPTSISGAEDQEVTIQANVLDSNGNVLSGYTATWESRRPEVAPIINPSGMQCTVKLHRVPGAFGGFGITTDQVASGYYPFWNSRMLNASPSSLIASLDTCETAGYTWVVNAAASRNNWTDPVTDRYRSDLYFSQIDRYTQAGIDDTDLIDYFPDTFKAIYVVDEPNCSNCFGGVAITLAQQVDMGLWCKTAFGRVAVTAVRAGSTSYPGGPVENIDMYWAQYGTEQRNGTFTEHMTREMNWAIANRARMMIGINAAIAGTGDAPPSTRGTWAGEWDIRDWYTAAMANQYAGFMEGLFMYGQDGLTDPDTPAGGPYFFQTSGQGGDIRGAMDDCKTVEVARSQKTRIRAKAAGLTSPEVEITVT